MKADDKIIILLSLLFLVLISFLSVIEIENNLQIINLSIECVKIGGTIDTDARPEGCK